jgi:hypothetical protein
LDISSGRTIEQARIINGILRDAFTLGRIADHKITRIDELLPWCYAQT